jgi:hypothetical protein
LPEKWAALRQTALGRSFPKVISLDGGVGMPTEIELPSPLTLIFGLNGVGKTRLLQAIADQYGCEVVSLSELIHYLKREVGARSDVIGLIDETSPLEGDKTRFDEVCDLVRRNYEQINWYVVPIADSPFQNITGEDSVPIFTVQYAGQTYDFRTMGLGELGAHLLMWILAYTKDAPPMPLFLDEPEAFMPGPSREVILSYLLSESVVRSEPIVLASHSLELIQPALDSSSAVYLAEASNVITPIGPSLELLERAAGLFQRSVLVDWLVLCEDEAAYILADEMLQNVAPRLWQSARFLWCNGYGDLEKIWEHLPRPERMQDGLLSFAFLADGDKETRVAATVEKRKLAGARGNARWPFLCLPGDPDDLMKSASESNVPLLAELFKVAEPKLSGILDRLRGRECHSWVGDVLNELGTDRQLSLRYLARAVIAETKSDGRLAIFATKLQQAGMLAQPQVAAAPSSGRGSNAEPRQDDV